MNADIKIEVTWDGEIWNAHISGTVDGQEIGADLDVTPLSSPDFSCADLMSDVAGEIDNITG
ncbi:hypothetical protein [Actinomadura atramentaria]|uniref:hypothetical protein n=1 Tax=Actinomadura atramentaria TaxID=1990 RepID=UPI00037C8A8F|nr:hypothetical protein [Actinomadura atramentaria]